VRPLHKAVVRAKEGRANVRSENPAHFDSWICILGSCVCQVIVIVGCAWALVGGKHLANAAKDR
jgi:hypothetical protein